MKEAAQRSDSLYVRVNPKTKKEAENIFGQFGITVSDAINMFLNKSIMEGGLPFEVKQRSYNAVTEAAMEEGDKIAKNPSAYKTYKNAREIFAEAEEEIAGENK